MDAPDITPAETTGDRIEGAPTAPALPVAQAAPPTPAGLAPSPATPAGLAPSPAASAGGATPVAAAASGAVVGQPRSPVAWVVPPGLPPRPSHPGA
ncbi:hypothetical protein [Streptomyces sp. NPDC006875]|uniref:hypothetical protein n=1 Tax=Streptomyces sp. NPDC006875 TaxID=3154781 RepID=UPI0033F211D2